MNWLNWDPTKSFCVDHTGRFPLSTVLKWTLTLSEADLLLLWVVTMVFTPSFLFHRQQACNSTITVRICSVKSNGSSGKISFGSPLVRVKYELRGDTKLVWSSGIVGCKAFESVNPFVMIAHVFLHLLSPLDRLLLLSALAAAAGIVIAVNLREYL